MRIGKIRVGCRSRDGIAVCAIFRSVLFRELAFSDAVLCHAGDQDIVEPTVTLDGISECEWKQGGTQEGGFYWRCLHYFVERKMSVFAEVSVQVLVVASWIEKGQLRRTYE